MVISAFGPYKDRVEIDFNKLGDNGIFLITGDTGSGKTTIFDALSFALFGEASGSRRENSSFRSDFAVDEVSTFVRLDFVHKDVVYSVERIPRYMRKKKRGDGVTAVGGEATLTYLDEVVTGEKNVTDKCVEILGMNASQFKQIVMIAQGEFLDLLLAKTKDRATIFRHIFDTGVYKDISDSLKNRYLLKRREYEDTAIEVKGYVKGVQLNCQLSGDESTEQVLELLGKELEIDNEAEKGLEAERDGLFKESSRIVEIISKGKVINNSILELSKSKEKLDELLKRQKEVKDKEKLVQRNRDIWDKIMPRYLEMVSVDKDLGDKRVKLGKASEECEVILKEYEKGLISYNGINEKLKEIQLCNKLIEDIEKRLCVLEEIEKKSDELDRLNRQLAGWRLREKREMLGKLDRVSECELEVSELRDKIVTLKDDYVKYNDNYGKHYDMFLSAQAGVLAIDLKEGQACPVCGSIEHPCLAKLIDDVLTREELDNEKAVLEDKYQSLEKLRLDLLEKEKIYEVMKQEVSDINKEDLLKEISELELSGAVATLEIDVSDVEKRIQQLDLSISEKRLELGSDVAKEKLELVINENRDIVNNLEKEIEKVRKDYELLLNRKSSTQSLVKVLSEDIGKLEKKLNVVTDEYVRVYQDLGYDGEEDYIKVRLERQDVDKLELEVRQYNDELVSVKSNISSLEKVINGSEKVKLDSFEEELKLVNEKLDAVNLSLKEINSKIFNNKKVYNNLKNVSEKTTKLEREVMVYKDLSDTANGSITGKSKLEFEQYVQASYFDRVLVSANMRLKFMTEDRYQLMRKEEAVKVSDKLGLELEIMDYYTGKRRDIKSLSGGESFKASLALALGMSDTIQEYSGGVVVDAMFIDEGFGSLDDESLEQALNAIMMLSQGNKIIGIISHVNELKARIDKKIVVKKSSSGSSVSLVV